MKKIFVVNVWMTILYKIIFVINRFLIANHMIKMDVFNAKQIS